MVLLPILAIGSRVRFWHISIPWGAKARAWIVLFGACILGRSVGYPDAVPVEVVWAVIDAIAGLIVLWPPKGEAQRAIGLLFVGMLLVDLGFFVSGWLQPGPRDYFGVAHFQSFLGWIQWACLFSWGVGDALEGVVRRAWSDRDQVSYRDGIR